MKIVKRPLTALSFRAKLWFGLGGLFFILLLVSGISAIVLTHFSDELQRLLRENYDSEVYCNEMTDALDRLDALARERVRDEAANPTEVSSQEKRFETNLQKQLRNITLPGEREESRRLDSSWKTYRQSYDKLGALPAGERQRHYAEALLPVYRDARASARRIAALNMDNVVSADGRVRKTMIGVRNVLLILVGAGALLAVVVLTAAGTTVLHPLRDLTRYARQIGAGDLDLKVQVHSTARSGNSPARST